MLSEIGHGITINSTLRFLALPFGLLLSAMGLVDPYPLINMRLSGMSNLWWIYSLALKARFSEMIWLTFSREVSGGQGQR